MVNVTVAQLPGHSAGAHSFTAGTLWRSHCASPGRLWNQLPDSFRQPRYSCLDSPPYPFINSSLSSFIPTLVILSLHNLINHSFTLSLQYLFNKSFPPQSRLLLPTGLPHDNGTGPDLSRSYTHTIVSYRMAVPFCIVCEIKWNILRWQFFIPRC